MIGYISLAISYIVLVALAIWILAKSNFGFIKIIIIPLLIWYGAFIYIVSETMLGYPTKSIMQDKTIIISYKIVEPQEGCNGGIYLWGIPLERILDKTSVPRSYQIPYDKKLHKKLAEKSQKSILTWQTNEKKSSNFQKLLNKFGHAYGETNGKFEILNPEEILTKRGTNQ